LQRRRLSVEGLRVAIQGFGNVGSTFARLVADLGATVVAVSDSSGGRYDPNGLDVAAALAHSGRDGSLAELEAGEFVTNEELLVLPCDVLVPCALEQVLTEENAGRVQASIVLEGANGPTTPAADEIFEANGVLVVPDVLVNSGGVVVSYFEWVQGLQEYFWKEEEVNDRLRALVARAFDETWELHETKGVPMRMAAYGLGAQRVAEASIIRGLYP
jgi:glutamate dehydrogenase (NAD(P)+)